MRTLTLLFLILPFIIILGSCDKKKVRLKPNILFIMADDHAKKAISCYGEGLNHTPNIDRLAEEGVKFQNAFVTNSICAPSRAVILTGKHSHLNGIIDNTGIFDTSQVTFPRLLRENGYKTAVIGKWHLKSYPAGFSYWNILQGQGEYYNPDFIEMGVKKQYKGYVTRLITDISLEWLKQQAEEKNPFCLMMHHKAPHRNWMPDLKNLNKFDAAHIPVPETFFDDYSTRGSAAREQEMEIVSDLYDGYDLKLSEGFGSEKPAPGSWTGSFDRMTEEQRDIWNKAYRQKNDEFYRQAPEGKDLAVWKFTRYMQDYLATIESLDESVGRILGFLEDNGLLENTLVIYTSDQGFYLGEHGWFDKRFIYEESLGTPLLVRMPEAQNKSLVCNELVQNPDIAPTILDFAGVEIPHDMQGLSFLPWLENKTGKTRDAIYYHYYEYPGVHAVKRHYGVRTARYKLIHYYYDVDEWELYDLESDPFEIQNLYGINGYEEITSQLKEKLNQLRDEYHVPTVREELAMRCDTVEHAAIGSNYILEPDPSMEYQAYPGALTDGIVSVSSFFWPADYSLYYGFNGSGMAVVIDLNKVTSVHSVLVRLLHNPSAWIYSPEKIAISYSTDGNSFSESKGEYIRSDGQIRYYGVENLDVNTRFVKVQAENFGKIPAGSPGEGSASWLFCDEIIVE